MNPKRQAREFCFQFFFHLQLPIFKELRSGGRDEILKSIEDFKASIDMKLDPTLMEFVENSVMSTLNHYDEITKTLETYSKNWKIERLAKVDYTNLLLSINELLFTKDAKPKVVINEAVEISKKFGSVDSSSFINGVLDKIINDEYKK